MSTTGCPTKNPLQRDGTSQYQRMLDALDPGYANIHEFSLADWMLFAWHFSQKLNYFSISNDKLSQGDWRNFMLAQDEIQTFLQSLQKADVPTSVEPHLALFLSFLKLMEEPQRQMNRLTGKHLNFYYQRVLQLKKKPAIEDRVYLIFELAKNISSFKLDDNSLFAAGKDQSKPPKPLEYIIEKGPVIYKAKIALLKSIYHQQNISMRYAEVANSADGSGAALNKQNPVWHAFGFDKIPVEKDSSLLIELPVAKLGFALASSIFLLKEGQRKIIVTMDLSFPSGGMNYIAFNLLKDQLVVLLTGEKGWISPQSVTVNRRPSTKSNQLEFIVEIDKAEKAIVAYDKKLHQENFNTTNPVMRVLLQTGTNTGYKAWREFSKASLIKTRIQVEVKEMKELLIENDEGKLDPAKPFLPFGPVPKKGSDFYAGNPEVFQKEWKSISLNIEWKDKPTSFKDHYFAYQRRFLTNIFTRNSYNLRKDNNGNILNNQGSMVTDDNYFSVDVAFIKNNRWSDAEEKKLFAENPMEVSNTNNLLQSPFGFNFGFTQLFSTGYNKSNLYVQNYLVKSPAKTTFSYATFNPGYQLAEDLTPGFTAGTKNNFLRFRLNQDFFHSDFPILYAAAMTVSGGIIPKEPYTPVIASLSLDYTAEITNDFAINAKNNEQKLKDYKDRNIQLFQESPFGQNEQHIFLKEQQPFIANKSSINIVPQYNSEGEFFIGLSDAETATILSILFEVAEGSENPNSPSFEKNQEILWHVLCNNEWKGLNADFIISDDTNHLLRSGIIKFLIPEEATMVNTILPTGFLWLKATLPQNIKFDSVSKLIDVLAQADEARFLNNNNELSHLKTALPESTISKMVNKQAAIKSVTQPFNSFGGLQQESDKQFYIRVSERLRHKNRAVNIWDYERLVLEKFPVVYKIKCLNHTFTDLAQLQYFELAPGYVRIIPLPDVRNKNIYDILQPRVSKNTLIEIQDFLNNLNGFHVDCKAINPEFEEIKFDMKVKFHEGYDPKAYSRILNSELKKYLAPWAFNDYAEIQFGGALYKSRVIAFIEELPYVDFITDFKMYNMKFGEKNRDDIAADSSRAILTSYKDHAIEPIQPPVCL